MSRLIDQSDRDLAVRATHRTVVVDAGAGSGKTHILVDRICQLVDNGVPIREVAAVTFTESAAGELRDRIRAALARSQPNAVADLDAAAIGTLHSFAHRILAEHPVQAGLPPVIEVLDEVASSVRIDRWWTTVRGQMLADDGLADALRILLDAGVRVSAATWGESLEKLALRMQADWDLVEDLLAHDSPVEIQQPDLGPCQAILSELAAVAEQCTDEHDKLLARIGQILAWGRGLPLAEDVGDLLDVWRAAPSFRVGNLGRAGNWPDIAAVRSRVLELGAVEVFAPVLDAALRNVVSYLAQQILRAADERRREGQLFYHDLLVLARRVLRTNEQVRVHLRQRYRYLLLDEFQDTDPIQVELAVRIAAGAEGGKADWRDCPVPAGSLVVVGDPKQSIYRFRRADIATYMQATEVLGRDARAGLVTNFRSHERVLAWINHVFGELIIAQPGVQPGYEALAPSPERGHPADRARVVLVTGEEQVGQAEARLSEARHIADVIATALVERWPFGERTIRASDITVLVPARSHLPALEEALIEARVPFRLMARSLIYGSEEIRDLLLVAAAADDPSNELMLGQALRTPILKCGDDDLWAWRAAGGSWRVWAPPPSELDDGHPVSAAMAFLKGLNRRLRTMSPSEVLTAIADECDLLALAAAHPAPAEIWRRYRIVIDQARQWAHAEHGSLREYLSWARTRADEEDRQNEVVLPERDADDVSVMTIHAAKGLQFGMVVVAGMISKPSGSPGCLVWEDNGAQVSLGKAARTLGWAAAAEDETQRLLQEDRRLLYVACTRAEEYLVVSGFGEQGQRGALLREAAAGADQQLWDFRGTRLPARSPNPAAEPAPGWQQRHQAVVRASGIRRAVSAGAIAHGEVPVPEGLDLGGLPPGLDKAARDLEKPAWLKGRYGTEIGRAVHATLQSVDLATGEGLEGTARAQALAEGVAEHADIVVALALSGFGAPVSREAARHRHQKETFVGTVAGGQVVEGFIDLLYTDDDGRLVVVDYKTDSEPSDQTIGEYRKQLAVYAAALRDATGLQVGKRVLVFCREGEAVEVEV